MNTTYLLLLLGVASVIFFVFIKSKKQGNSNADPMAEAEVYLAYGRKKQAIELLEEAQLAHPNRADIRKKLDELRIKP